MNTFRIACIWAVWGLYGLFSSLGYADTHDSATVNYERLADSIYLAEGGTKASVPYGIMFKGCSWDDVKYCRKICLNTLRNQYKRWQVSKDFPTYWGSLWHRYAPPSAHPLNKNWLKNVRYHYEKM